MVNKINILHVPKTAGTSIRLTLATHFLYRHFFAYCGHEICFRDLSQSQKKSRAIIILRPPDKWYVSLYNFKLNSNPNCVVKIYPNMDGNSWEDFVADCVSCSNGVEGIRKWFRPWELYHNRIIQHLRPNEGLYSAFYRFYTSLGAEENLFAANDTQLFVVGMENLERDFNRVVRRVYPFLPLIRFKRENVTSETALKKNTVSQEEVSLLQQNDRRVFSDLARRITVNDC